MGLWATWSSWRCPCSLKEGWARWPLKVPSNPKHSMILWLLQCSSDIVTVVRTGAVVSPDLAKFPFNKLTKAKYKILLTSHLHEHIFLVRKHGCLLHKSHIYTALKSHFEERRKSYFKTNKYYFSWISCWWHRIFITILLITYMRAKQLVSLSSTVLQLNIHHHRSLTLNWL